MRKRTHRGTDLSRAKPHMLVTLAGLACLGGMVVACVFDQSGLVPPDAGIPPGCGDGVIADGEECDGTNLGGETCASLGLGTGILGCTPLCTFDVEDCHLLPGCGDGVIADGEECDGTNLGGETCHSLTGLADGTLSCLSDCTFDSTLCHHCGNDVVEGPEQCDGLNLQGLTCTDLGYLWGELRCGESCFYQLDGCHDTPENWHDLRCPYRKMITVLPDHVQTPLAMFPLVVMSTDADLRDKAQDDGSDLVFASADGSQRLAQELELFSGETGEIVAWVGIPSLSDSTPTVFYLYYGHPDCGQGTSIQPSSVWDVHFRGVWHLSEGGTGPRHDSTANALHAAPGNYDGDEAAQGMLDGADRLDGTNDHLVIPGGAMGGLTTFTVCFWVRTTESRSHTTNWRNPTLFGQITTGYQSADFGILTQNGIVGMRSGLCSGSDQLNFSGIAINDDQWHYLCAVSDYQSIALYVNDVLGATVCTGGRAVHTQVFWLGGQSGQASSESGSFHQGVYDALQVSAVARSGAWLHASFVNQGTPSSFYTIGAEESL